MPGTQQDRCGAADPATGARDESHFACEPWHRFLLLDRKIRKQPEAVGSHELPQSPRHQC